MNPTRRIIPLVLLLLAAALPAAVEPVDLDSCIALALAHNSAIALAEENAVGARAKIEESKSQYLPQVTASGSYTRLSLVSEFTMPFEGQMRTFTFMSPDNFSLKVGLSEQVFNWGRTARTVEISRLAVALADDALEAARIQTAYLVVPLFYGTLFFQEAGKVVEENLDLFRQKLHIAEQRYEKGLVSSFDLSLLRVQIAALEQQKMEITGNLLKLAQSFNRLCGRPLETPFAPAAPFTLEPRSETGETLLQRARVERMDYRQLRRQEQLADLQLRLVRCGDKPSVVFSFAYEVRNGVMPDVGRLRGSWSAVLSATYPLFDGFRTRAQVSAADSGRRAAQKRLVDLEQSMTAEIAGLLTDLQTIEQKLTVEQEKIRHAEKALQIADERHKTGLISVTDLIEAQNTLENARLNRLQLTYNHILTRFQLDRASGRKLHP